MDCPRRTRACACPTAVVLAVVLLLHAAGPGAAELPGVPPRAVRSATPPETQVQAVRDLIARLLGPAIAPMFILSLAPAPADGHDHYTLSTRTVGTATQVAIEGTSGVALASGFHWYLKYYCNCSVSWGVNGTGDNLVLPSPLPGIHGSLTMRSPVRYRYYLNVCTHSYSAAWWRWERWEQEIDWMALHGINLPLSSTGEEYLFAKVFKSLGLNDTDLDGFFVGPAFLAWGRMGNIQGWAGPLYSEWLSDQAALQKRILQRQREFGMTPVLPAFAGFVPAGIKRIYPDANLTESADWAGFPRPYSPTYLLSPLDPLFRNIGGMVIRQLVDEFGTDHIYNADTFNEMPPSSGDPKYLAAASRAVYEGMAVEDPKALWVMQGWAFSYDSFWTKARIQAYLSGVDDDELLVLDLASDNSPVWSKTDSYFGKPFVWCMLHNGGGVRGLYGNLTQYATDPILALAAPNSTMAGVGMTMEAIEQNPVVYELMSEMGWRSDFFNVSEWVQRYAERRYGSESAQIAEAWSLLREATYEQSGLDTGFFELKMGYGGASNATQEVASLRQYLAAARSRDTFTPNGPYLYDCVDLTRQVLANTFRDVYTQFNAAYQAYSNRSAYSLDQFKSLGSALLDLIRDIDALLRSNPNYLLGTWISQAISWARSPDQASLYQFNARNQITLWGPQGQICDYATKHWADLLSTYYLPRWSLFVTSIVTAVASGKPFDDQKYGEDVLQLEEAWNHLNTTYQTTPSGDTLANANALATKYLDQSSREPLYRRIPNTDAYGPNVMSHPTWSKDLAQLMWLCSINPMCQGFNTNGWLKANVTRRLSAAVDLYVKIAP